MPSAQVQLFDQLADGFLSTEDRLSRTGSQEDIEFALRELAASSDQSAETKVDRLRAVYDGISDGTYPIGPFAEAVIDIIGLTATTSGSTTIDTATFSLRGYLQEATGSADLQPLGNQIVDPALRQRFGQEVTALGGAGAPDYFSTSIATSRGEPLFTVIVANTDAQGKPINSRLIGELLLAEVARFSESAIGNDFLLNRISLSAIELNSNNATHAPGELGIYKPFCLVWMF